MVQPYVADSCRLVPAMSELSREQDLIPVLLALADLFIGSFHRQHLINGEFEI